jgi:hypothetical protein
MASILSVLCSFAARLSRDQSGAVAQILALAVLPLVFAAGAAAAAHLGRVSIRERAQ